MTALDRGNADPARAEQIRRAEDAVNRQQFEVDRLVAQSRRMGCESSGFFSIFSNPPPQCGPLNRQIEQQRAALERMQNDLERLSRRHHRTRRAAPVAADRARQQRLRPAIPLGGARRRARRLLRPPVRQQQRRRLFAARAPMGGTFRTICVRTCDGFYFPISYATSPDRFRDDEQTCQRMCPAAEVQLYTYHNPGEEVTQAVSLNGRLYTELPTAFQYRKALDAGLQLPARRAKAGPTRSRPAARTTRSRRATSSSPNRTPRSCRSRASAPTASRSNRPAAQECGGAAAAEAADRADAPGEPDPAKRTVRTVGPTFLPRALSLKNRKLRFWPACR